MKGNAVDPARFAPFQPLKVLYDFDGPRTFTFLDRDGELNLALWFDENAQAVRFLVVPFSAQLLDKLETGQISVREALEQPRLWVVDVDNRFAPVVAVRANLADLPQEELPVPGTKLLPALEPRRLAEENARPAPLPSLPTEREIPSSPRRRNG